MAFGTDEEKFQFARFAQLNREWLRGRGCAFANGLPSRAAFRNLLVRLDPALFGECLKAVFHPQNVRQVAVAARETAVTARQRA